MTGLTCLTHAEETRPTPRYLRRWEQVKAQAVSSEQPLYAVVYDVEIRAHMGWGAAIPSPVASWQTPEKILDDKASMCKTYRTGAILDLAGLRHFQQSVNMTACRKRPINSYNALRGREKKLLTAFERFPIPPFQEEPAVIELAGSSHRDLILSQHAYVIPFLMSRHNSQNICDLVEEAYIQLSSSQ